MTTDAFMTELLTAAEHLGCPLDDEARSLLRQTLKEYEPQWMAGGSLQAKLKSIMQIVVLRAVMNARSAEKPRVDGGTFRIALAKSPLPSRG